MLFLSAGFLQRQYKSMFKDESWTPPSPQLPPSPCSELDFMYYTQLGQGKKRKPPAEKSLLRLNYASFFSFSFYFFLSVSEDIDFCETLTTVALHQFVSRLKSSWTEQEYEKKMLLSSVFNEGCLTLTESSGSWLNHSQVWTESDCNGATSQPWGLGNSSCIPQQKTEQEEA